MPRRHWDARTQAMIVLEGLKGKPGAELGHEHHSSQALSDPWRAQFRAHAAPAFEVQTRGSAKPA